MKLQYILVAALVSTIPSHAVEFQNVDFDSPNTNNLTTVEFTIPPVRYQVGTTADLLPGWRLTYDRVPYQGVVEYNYGNNDVPNINYAPLAPFANKYYVSFFLSAASPGQPGAVRHDLSLWQIGRVPDNAWDLLTFGGDFLCMNGVALTPRSVEGFRQNAWDVRPFAGKEVKFEIRSYDQSGVRGFGLIDIDIFGFAIPEPSEWALLLLGGGMLFWAGSLGSVGGRRK